ncbi:MAG: DUF1700 domain-containing protein [Lachnospiraceae bacterium]
MNRTEYMVKLETVLTDVSAEERCEALQYYNDYFDEAGAENEAQVIEELGSPVKLGATIRAGLRGNDEESGEFRETGYTDTRFEEKESPAKRGDTGYFPDGAKEKNKRDIWKIVAIILLVLIVSPVAIPIVCCAVAIVFGIIVAAFGIFIGVLATMVALVVAGLVVVIWGLAKIFPAPAVGLVFVGSGLILLAIGLVGSVLMAKVCMVVLPGMFRFIVDLCRKPFHKKEAQV